MMRSGFTAGLGATLFAVCLAVFVTWPQALHMGTSIFSHHDPYFSIWRISWVAHALVTSPFHLFDANIFYPAKDTLAYSDATLLEGLLAAPFLWMHVSPVLVYNVLFLAGFVGSGIAMFVLARHLTGATGPALVAAAVFTMAPYRIEHVMHLELQWAMFVPLTFWALHRAIDDRSWRFGILAGLGFWLQLLSCVYYGVFLAILLVAFVPLLLLLSGRRAVGALPGLAVGAVVAVVLSLPYLWPYVTASRAVGGRDLARDRALQRAPDQLPVGDVAQPPVGMDLRSVGRPRAAAVPGRRRRPSLAVQRFKPVLAMDHPVRSDRCCWRSSSRLA